MEIIPLMLSFYNIKLEGKNMNYWLHRISHENGYEHLEQKNVLTIGFSRIADQETLDFFKQKDWDLFENKYKRIYPDYMYGRFPLWRFAVGMQVGDIVVVPHPGSFKICEVVGELELYPQESDIDLGWQRKVRILAVAPSREGFAPAALVNRMKIRQTNADIQDLQSDVEEALRMIKQNKPFNLSADLAGPCAEIIRKNGSPNTFETLVKQYFLSCGADAQILSKNSSGKQGDCDIEAVFSSLNLVISVQAKFHDGQTDDWSVSQITEYANAQEHEPNMIYWQWVITSAEDFSPEAKIQEKKHHVRLITGREFAKMLIEQGITSLK